MYGLFFFCFEEENPHIFGERWFRQTGTKPRYGILMEESLQKRAKKCCSL
jgi:hypothetical protein